MLRFKCTSGLRNQRPMSLRGRSPLAKNPSFISREVKQSISLFGKIYMLWKIQKVSKKANID